jgi:serine protease Do
LNRDRVWSALVSASGDYSSAAGNWKLSGELAGGGNVEITLTDAASSGNFPQGAVELDAMQDLDQQLGPPGSGGLLAALHVWRQLLIQGPQKFGDVTYYGTAPHPGIEGLAEVLMATHNVAEIDFVFEDGADPCELRFSDYRDVSGRQVPHTLEVRHGDTTFGRIHWTQIEFAPAGEPKP